MTNSHDRERTEFFLAAFNRIEKHLRQVLQAARHVGFSQLVDRYTQERRGWLRREELRIFGDLRNLLVHETTRPNSYLAFPSPKALARIEAIANHLIDPPKVIPKFQREVETLETTDSLSQVFKTIASRDYSQFPVYSGREFRGLLTENGITRWLARHTAEKMSLIEFDEILCSNGSRGRRRAPGS